MSEQTIRARAVALREYGMTYREIGAALGISHTNARYLIDPEYAARSRANSRAAKRRRTGTCVDCGGVTRYNGHDGKAVSDRCSACQIAFQFASRVWTAEACIDAIQRFARANGHPPTAIDWLNADPENGYPNRGSVYRSTVDSGSPFATWNDAIAAAGFDPIPAGHYRDDSERRGPKPGRRKFDWDEAQVLRERGLTYAAIGAELGVTNQSVWRALNKVAA